MYIFITIIQTNTLWSDCEYLGVYVSFDQTNPGDMNLS